MPKKEEGRGGPTGKTPALLRRPRHERGPAGSGSVTAPSERESLPQRSERREEDAVLEKRAASVTGGSDRPSGETQAKACMCRRGAH